MGTKSNTQSILANMVMGHPKMHGLSLGLKAEFELEKKEIKGLEVSNRFDLDKS